MKKSFRDYYSWTLSDFFNELKRIGYGSDAICNRAAIYWQRQSSNLFTRDFRKKYFTVDTCCTICKGNQKIEVDHIIPIFAGGKNEESNLQFLCKLCHNQKTKQDYHKYKAQSK